MREKKMEHVTYFSFYIYRINGLVIHTGGSLRTRLLLLRIGLF
jgi:hypothetical protein